jgi:hypothetical protein
MEALTGASAGWVLTRETLPSGVPTSYVGPEGHALKGLTRSATKLAGGAMCVLNKIQWRDDNPTCVAVPIR